MDHTIFKVSYKNKVSLKDYNSSFTGEYHTKNEAKIRLEEDIKKLTGLQDVLYASNKYSLLIILQALDAAGKDSTIKHVMSGVNPQGCRVHSFKAPSAEELDHDYLWRCMKVVPEKGMIGIFNRSYYEEVLVTRVHPELLERQNLPPATDYNKIWKHRFEEINNFEKYLTQNGIVILKFYLNVSKKEQKERFIDRINKPQKNWKFSMGDATERKFWNEYIAAYEDMLSHTSTDYAPWFIIPADHKWYTRIAVSDIILSTLMRLNLKYPASSAEHEKELVSAKELLENE